MKNYKQILKASTIICLGIIFAQCSEDDDLQKPNIPLFSETDMELIHNNSEKTWRISEIVNDYFDPTYELEITLDCVTDDLYTFSSATESVTIDFGEVLCFDDIDDGIFSADHEFIESNLVFMDGFRGETIYLHFARGYINEDQTAQASTFTYYSLAELTSDRIVFQKGGEFVGEYKQALIFERVE